MRGRVPSIRMILLFALVFLVVVAWVALHDQENTALARSFLRHLARALF